MSSPALIQPTGEIWKQIRIELNENVDTRDQDLAHIKDWLRKQPHLPDEWDENRMMTFLRGCKFSLEKTKRKLDMYFTMRAACPEFFANRDIRRPELRDLLGKAQGPPLPRVTPNGRRVTIARALDPNVDAARLPDVFKIALMIGDIRLLEEKEGVGGDVYILDAATAVSPANLAKVSPTMLKKFLICVQFKIALMKDDIRLLEEKEGVGGDVYILDAATAVSLANLAKVSPTMLKKSLICVQEAYPVKLKEVHVVNASPLVDKIVSMVKPFLKQKLRERIFIHTDMKTLYDYVPRDILPEEYGGTSGNLDDLTEIWMKKLEEYGDWFKEQESVTANEALRPGKPTNYDELFGIDGSFRQLSID